MGAHHTHPFSYGRPSASGFAAPHLVRNHFVEITSKTPTVMPKGINVTPVGKQLGQMNWWTKPAYYVGAHPRLGNGNISF